MYEIRCMKDIKALTAKKALPFGLLKQLVVELAPTISATDM